MGRQKTNRRSSTEGGSRTAGRTSPSGANSAPVSAVGDGLDRQWWQSPLIQSLAIMLGLMVLLWSLFVPRWETNDDCFMSMIAHGYGIAAEASPKLVFSNVLWGYLVQMIPWVGGTPGYSIAAAASLLLAGTAAGFALRRMDVPWYLVALLIILCFVRPLLLCQFTVNAGLLAASGVLCAIAFLRGGGSGVLLLGCASLVLGAMVRLEQVALVIVVGAPLIQWPRAIRSTQFLAALSVIAVSVVSMTAIDYGQFGGSEWDHFKRFRSVQVPITDYQAGVRLLQSPELMATHRVTGEEVAMIQRWGFVGKELGDPSRLGPAIEQLGSPANPRGLLQGAWAGVTRMFDTGLLWLTVASLIVLAVSRQVPLIASWILFVLFMAVLGAMGRPGVERVYVPIYLLLIGGGLAVAKQFTLKSLLTVAAALCVSSVAMAPRLMMSAEGNSQMFTRNGIALKSLNDMTVVAWGWWLRYERIYPAWGAIPMSSIRIIGLNSFTHAPYSVAEFEERSGRGVLNRIDTQDGALFVSTDANFPLLERYLRSAQGWNVMTEEFGAYPDFRVTRVKRAPG
jgi:hypothetical protein